MAEQDKTKPVGKIASIFGGMTGTAVGELKGRKERLDQMEEGPKKLNPDEDAMYADGAFGVHKRKRKGAKKGDWPWY